MTVTTVRAPDGTVAEAVFRTSVTVAFCAFLLIKLVAPELLDTGLSVTSQVLLLVTLLMAATLAGWAARRRRCAAPHDKRASLADRSPAR